MSGVSVSQEEAGSAQQEGGEQREEEGGKMEADKPTRTESGEEVLMVFWVLFAGEGSDRRSAGQRHREGAAGATEAGNGTRS